MPVVANTVSLPVRDVLTAIGSEAADEQPASSIEAIMKRDRIMGVLLHKIADFHQFRL
jgi:hypothetical protein